MRNAIRFFVFLSFFSFLAEANDTAVALFAGGIQMVKAEKIALRSEKLQLSQDKVKVSYEFFNTADQDQELEVAFPLPEIRGEAMSTFAVDEMYHLYTYLSANGSPSFNGSLKSHLIGRAIGDFELKIEGKHRAFHYRYSAVDFEGKDITGQLMRESIPLSLSFLNGWEEEGELVRDPELKENLKGLGLLTQKGEAAWINQMTYFWSDTFPAQKIHRVEHEYTPVVGHQWVSSKKVVKSLEDIAIAQGRWAWKDYCPSKAFEKKLVSAFSKRKNWTGNTIADEPYPAATEIRYILTTANSWNGGIGKLELEVVPPTPDTLIAFCWPKPVKQDTRGRVRLTETQFEPKEELRVLFLEPRARVAK